MPNYDNEFFKYVNSGAIQSAKILLPEIQKQLKIQSVLDVGCGQGGWLKVWKELGCETTCGIDGDYVIRDQLLIEPSEFIATDLSERFNLNQRFDLVQTLEVGEHLPSESSVHFVDSLVSHSDFILFSAAAKGQGGDHHVNEQDYEFWRQHFARHNYVAIDYLRPMLKNDKRIEPWYRYNAFLYVSKKRLTELPQALQDAQIPDNQTLTDVSPTLYKIRKSLIRLLPVPVVTKIAKIKEARVLKKRTHDTPAQ